jgi:hypothetical protein
MRIRTLLVPLFLSACSADGGLGDDDDWRPGEKADDAAAVKLQYKTYDVLFTNPLCKEYVYAEPVETADGEEMLTVKPRNVYCSHLDMAQSADRPSSPQHKLIEWIEPLGEGDEIFLAYLSFSNAAVGDQLCAAAGRGTKVTFVLDAPSTQSERLAGCGATILLRGHAGSIGFAHNKVVLINPKGRSAYMKMSFSSGNMSSGVVTHHENWHFIDVKRKSYFATAHVCLMEAQIDEEASSGRTQYKNFLNECRGAIEEPEETDIKAFFIPSRDDAKRAEKYLLEPIAEAASIDLGAHRFGHTKMIQALAGRLGDGSGFTLRMVADDDMYWLDPMNGDATEVGANQFFEAENVQKLEDAGGDAFEIRFFETNHAEHLLHHNKYLLYRDENGKPFGLIAGAANLTGSGFNDNFENIYFIKVPKVLDAFDTQFARVWDGRRAAGDEQDPPVATPREKMPARDMPGE